MLQLEVFRQTWGQTRPLEEIAQEYGAMGYAGLEIWTPGVANQRHLAQVLASHALKLIALLSTRPDPVRGDTVEVHLDALRNLLDQALELGPALINVHGGRDGWSASDQDRFFEAALAEIDQRKALVAFETHRGRPTYSPWNTLRLLKQFPQLRLTLDLSHWVVVCERLLEDQQPALEAAAAACVHLHARVGYDQGPQVPDPRAPEYAPQLAAHQGWWEQVWDRQLRRGDTVSTLTPEFGPPPYMHTLPYTQQPVASQAEVSDWMAAHQKEAFARWQERQT